MASLDLRLYEEAKKFIDDRLEQLAAEIVSGKATDYADYRYRSGRLKGLQDALEALVTAQRAVLGLDRK